MKTRLLVTSLFLVGLSACNEGPAEEFGAQLDDAAGDLNQAAENTADDLNDAATDAANAVEDACEDVADRNC